MKKSFGEIFGFLFSIVKKTINNIMMNTSIRKITIAEV